ncbi:MAG: crossover junction endodeoxyribonuclease RuvC [Actinomycetales bacterium]|nr:crossover junction endodeoxyribonuclease RuvC [Actinomycetales bacterium]
MRVLGVDPGLTRCGVAVVDGDPGRSMHAEYIGVIATEPALPVQDRLATVYAGIAELVETYAIDVIAVERVFSQHNVHSAMGTAQSGAMALLIAGQRGISIAVHTPTEVKAAITGHGRADKAQVAAMVVRLLRLAEPPRPADAADAAAIALCQILRGSAMNRLQQLSKLRP